MKKLIVIAALSLFTILFVSFSAPNSTGCNDKNTEDSLAKARAKFVSQLLDSLQDKKYSACDSVFKNLRIFHAGERVKVEHFLAIMDYWGEALGVNCTYCHSASSWASDSLKTKNIAREMYQLRQKINKEFARINEYSSEPSNSSRVNCGTCHNGKTIPN